ncbi:protein CURLY FLAG LEAF 1-like [Aristolochia californica]|uniref:protein CURLY FLAG LEAF 1-like n=1 Tax=Aristolochia californica TaxID=171875 RepID=UPI0035DCDFE1
MAAEVSSLVRILNGYKDEESSGAGKKGLITRDFLGGCSIVGSKELDLDLQVPNGWEKRLDMKSGKIYLHRNNSPTSTTSNEWNPQPQMQDLNFPPSSSSSFLDDGLDLKLVPSGDYQSVCTLEKVKFALERAERGSNSGKKRFYFDGLSSSPASSSEEAKSMNSSESEKKPDNTEKMFAAGCPGCLLYVLISKGNPRCPRCDSIVPFPSMKKPRIDLNYSAL